MLIELVLHEAKLYYGKIIDEQNKFTKNPNQIYN